MNQDLELVIHEKKKTVKAAAAPVAATPRKSPSNKHMSSKTQLKLDKSVLSMLKEPSRLPPSPMRATSFRFQSNKVAAPLSPEQRIDRVSKGTSTMSANQDLKIKAAQHESVHNLETKQDLLNMTQTQRGIMGSTGTIRQDSTAWQYLQRPPQQQQSVKINEFHQIDATSLSPILPKLKSDTNLTGSATQSSEELPQVNKMMRVEVELNKSSLDVTKPSNKRMVYTKNIVDEDGDRQIETKKLNIIQDDFHKFIVSDRAESCQKALNPHLVNSSSYQKMALNKYNLLNSSSQSLIDYQDKLLSIPCTPPALDSQEQAQGCLTTDNSMQSEDEEETHSNKTPDIESTRLDFRNIINQRSPALLFMDERRKKQETAKQRLIQVEDLKIESDSAGYDSAGKEIQEQVSTTSEKYSPQLEINRPSYNKIKKQNKSLYQRTRTQFKDLSPVLNKFEFPFGGGEIDEQSQKTIFLNETEDACSSPGQKQTGQTIFLYGTEETCSSPRRKNYDKTHSLNSDIQESGVIRLSSMNQTVSLLAVKQNQGVIVRRGKDSTKNLSKTLYDQPSNFKPKVQLKLKTFKSPSTSMIYTDKLYDHKKTCIKDKQKTLERKMYTIFQEQNEDSASSPSLSPLNSRYPTRNRQQFITVDNSQPSSKMKIYYEKFTKRPKLRQTMHTQFAMNKHPKYKRNQLSPLRRSLNQVRHSPTKLNQHSTITPNDLITKQNFNKTGFPSPQLASVLSNAQSNSRLHQHWKKFETMINKSNISNKHASPGKMRQTARSTFMSTLQNPLMTSNELSPRAVLNYHEPLTIDRIDRIKSKQRHQINLNVDFSQLKKKLVIPKFANQQLNQLQRRDPVYQFIEKVAKSGGALSQSIAWSPRQDDGLYHDAFIPVATHRKPQQLETKSRRQ